MVTNLISNEKERYYKKLLHKTSNNIKQKWSTIRLIINRAKVQQSNCNIPNNILGQHYSTIAQKLADKLPKMTNDDIPTTSKIRKCTKSSKTHFTFNKTTDREVYEILLKLD